MTKRLFICQVNVVLVSLCGRFVAVLVCGRFGCTPSADGLVLVLSAARVGKQEANPWKSLGPCTRSPTV